MANTFPYILGLKFRAFPSTKQKELIQVNFDSARFVYNQLIANSWTDSNIVKPNGVNELYPQIKRATGLRRIKNNRKYFWLHDKRVDSLALMNAENDFKAAWNMFRKVHEVGTPNFKRKFAYQHSYSTNCLYSKDIKDNCLESIFNGSARFEDSNHIKLPKLGLVKVKNKLNIPTKQRVRISRVTVSQTSDGNYYISLLIKSDQPLRKAFAKTNQKVGIDLNLDNFLMDSNGNTVANPRYYKHAKKRLAFEQRILSRRQTRSKKEHRKLWQSKNYQKQRQRVAKLQAKVKHQRENFLQQLSTTLIKNHDLVVAEELRSKNLLKNHALAQTISDVGWRTFLSMLEYKAKLYDKQFETVNPAYTTQTCFDCGYVMKGSEHLTLKDREWTCPNCGVFHIRDVNAAKNILAKI